MKTAATTVNSVTDLGRAPPPPETMTARQLDRRRRVLDAAHALLGEMAVHEVQMRAIAERSSVSLAAIYHYFSSKHHVLGEALVDWAHGVWTGPAPAPRRGSDFVELVRRGVRAFAGAPQYAEVFVQIAVSTDDHAIECMARLWHSVDGRSIAALGQLDSDTAHDLQRLVAHALAGGLFECVHGRQTFAELEHSLVTASRILVEGGRWPRA